MRHFNRRFCLTLLPCLLVLSGPVDPESVDEPTIGAAQGDNCEHEVVGTSSPPSSGNPTVIDDISGTVISANFFNSGAIDPPYFDGMEFLSVCVKPADETGKRTATITTDVGLDNDFHIKGYPEFVVGTKFGNIYETSFRYYPNTGLPPEDQWPVRATGLDGNGNPYEFANLEYVAAKKNVGLPAFTNALPEIVVTLDVDEINVEGAERDVMLESWFHDTATHADIIGDNAATNTPLSGTLNNIVGVGHRHYPELDNTLLEMMVHIGPLSPNDISGATNNPGQNQLTEIFSGKDFDGDGIDDHFDVDSHLYLDSTDPTAPSPGIYSSGVDDNGDGIDDADLLPIVIGEFAYSIWYGETFLAPIVIFSRETGRSLTNDFDPNTPDMDLSSEGEITLRWNDFLEYTLFEVESQLQSIGVDWATGVENPFPGMRSSGGAISGVEFGVEPQTNTPSDVEYRLDVKKFLVNVDGGVSGLANTKILDMISPNVSITMPEPNAVFGIEAVAFSGSATDTGGSGVREVRFAIRNRTLARWFNFADNAFTDAIGNGSVAASLTNINESNSSWQYTVPELPAGEYTLFVRAIDNADNSSEWISSKFDIEAIDNQNPELTIGVPTGGQILSPNELLFSGMATDTDSSGVNEVRLAIRSRSLSKWFNFDESTFDGAIGNGSVSASLSTANQVSTEWTQTVASLPTGDYTLFVRAIDNAGNSSEWITRAFSVTINDTLSPDVSVESPPANAVVFAEPFLLSGSATDQGDAGIREVRVAILNQLESTWFNFEESEFGNTIGNGSTTATLTNPDAIVTDWTLSVPALPAGKYTAFVRVIDTAGNSSQWITHPLTILPNDNQSPEVSVSEPAANVVLASSEYVFSGAATDFGEAGIRDVRVAVRSRSLSEWFNFDTGLFSGAVGNGATSAILADPNQSFTQWSTNIPALPEGLYTVFVRSIDNSDNSSNWIARQFSVE
jgi:hypothetical protein